MRIISLHKISKSPQQALFSSGDPNRPRRVSPFPQPNADTILPKGIEELSSELKTKLDTVEEKVDETLTNPWVVKQLKASDFTPLEISKYIPQLSSISAFWSPIPPAMQSVYGHVCTQNKMTGSKKLIQWNSDKLATLLLRSKHKYHVAHKNPPRWWCSNTGLTTPVTNSDLATRLLTTIYSPKEFLTAPASDTNPARISVIKVFPNPIATGTGSSHTTYTHLQANFNVSDKGLIFFHEAFPVQPTPKKILTNPISELAERIEKLAKTMTTKDAPNDVLLIPIVNPTLQAYASNPSPVGKQPKGYVEIHNEDLLATLEKYVYVHQPNNDRFTAPKDYNGKPEAKLVAEHIVNGLEKGNKIYLDLNQIQIAHTVERPLGVVKNHFKLPLPTATIFISLKKSNQDNLRFHEAAPIILEGPNQAIREALIDRLNFIQKQLIKAFEKTPALVNAINAEPKPHVIRKIVETIIPPGARQITIPVDTNIHLKNAYSNACQGFRIEGSKNPNIMLFDLNLATIMCYQKELVKGLLPNIAKMFPYDKAQEPMSNAVLASYIMSAIALTHECVADQFNASINYKDFRVFRNFPQAIAFDTRSAQSQASTRLALTFTVSSNGTLFLNDVRPLFRRDPSPRGT